MDCGWITSKRTGAATAVATCTTLRAQSLRAVGILGCGVQGRGNLEALNLVFRLRGFAHMMLIPKPERPMRLKCRSSSAWTLLR